MKRFLWVVVGICVLFADGCGRKDSSDAIAPRQYMDTAMGTVIQQTVYCTGEEGQEFFRETMTLLEELEEMLLSWRLDTSELYRVNAAAGSPEGAALSREMADILKQCLVLYEDSEGAFDVTIGPVTRLWDIDGWAAGKQEGEFQPPDPDALSRALENCGSGRIRLAEGEPSRIFMPEGMELDLGAAGKGIALERLQSLLSERPEIPGAVLSVGGSVLTYGSKPDGSMWKVGIVNPADTSSNIGVLTLEGQWCISTSGDYERYAEAEGVRYHHILDPETGYPADSGVRGVTILTKDGFAGDMLSTACFILGPEKGMALAEKYGAEALFVMRDGELIMTEGMEEYLSVRGK